MNKENNHFYQSRKQERTEVLIQNLPKAEFSDAEIFAKLIFADFDEKLKL